MALFAARYARAFADVVESEKIPQGDVNRQLNDVSATLGESRELREVLLNPAMPVETRIRVIDALAPKLGISRAMRNLLAVLLRHERLSSFDEIVRQYHAEMDRRQGLAKAEVVSARRLDEGERAALEQQVSSLARTQVRATFREDRDLLGGVLVRIGSTVYDGSVRGRLERLKEELISR